MQYKKRRLARNTEGERILNETSARPVVEDEAECEEMNNIRIELMKLPSYDDAVKDNDVLPPYSEDPI